MNYFFILCLFSFTNQEFISTSTNYFHHIHCNNKLYIKINSIKYNGTIILHQNIINRCSNQSSCWINFKPFLFPHIRVNYSCIKDHNQTEVKTNSTTNTIILGLCIILFVSLISLICSYLRHCSINDDTRHIYIQYQYELKNLSVIESSSSSTLTSLNNKNIITNPSEYDNLIKNTSQSSEYTSPLKVKFNENHRI
jgi:hypothetical protein